VSSTTYETILEDYDKHLRDGVLPIQQCGSCGTRQFFPRTICTTCLSREVEWTTSAGTGEIHRFSVLYRSPDPDRALPYALALVDLDEGVRMLVMLDDPADPRLSCGTRVRLQRIDDGKLAVFEVSER
jgi:uncharacterized OB-fold protein